MAKSPNQKTKLLHLARMLLRQTDEDHPLTVTQLIEELFLSISHRLRVFWEHHFGVIGVDATMYTDNIEIY